MNKKSFILILLTISLIISHIPCFASIEDIPASVIEEALPIVAPISAIGVALPIVAAPIVAQSSIPTIVAFAGYILIKMVLQSIAPLPVDDIFRVPPRDNKEKIINPGEVYHQRRYTLTNNTDKPIIYDQRLGKVFETNYSQEDGWVKGKEKEIKPTFKW